LELFGKRQQELLRLLGKHPDGRSIDELAAALGVSRPAVRQHLVALEGDGYVTHGAERRTPGRPVQPFVLTEKGQALFPRQYSWFSGLLLDGIARERGPEGLAAWLEDLAGPVAASLEPGLAGLTGEARLQAIAAAMNQLAFEAEAPGDGTIAASNCIYHELARRHPELCRFDIALLSRLAGAPLAHETCMTRGDGVCRFRAPKATDTP
jgi:predicted ArsR family transcriptional regulator